MIEKCYNVTFQSNCLKRPSIRMTWKSLLTGGCLLLNESSAESMSFLHFFHATISNHLSASQNMYCFIWSLNTGLTDKVIKVVFQINASK